MRTVSSSSDSSPLADPPRTSVRFASQVGFIYRQWRKVLNRRLKAHGLTDASWAPLLALSKAGRPMRQKELADYLFLDTSSMVRILNQLREAALVDWAADPEDRRAKLILLTASGWEQVREIEGASRSLEAEALRGIAAEDVATTRAVLARIAERIGEIELGAQRERSEEGAGKAGDSG